MDQTPANPLPPSAPDGRSGLAATAAKKYIKITFDPNYSGYVLDVLFTEGVGRVDVKDDADLAAKLRRVAGLRNIGFKAEIVTEE